MTLRTTTRTRTALATLALLPCLACAGAREASLAQAVRSADEAATRTALAARVDINRPLPDGSTPLAWAVESQNANIVRMLLERGAQPDVPEAASFSPLLVACQHADPVILDLLLDAAANVKAVRADGVTPLSICAANASPAVLERMIAAGAAADRPDERGQTPLMWAAAHGRIDNMKLLVQHGAQVNRATAKGLTPLFFALKSGVPQAPLAVLEAGGDADYVAPDGTSVVQLALYQKDYDFAARMIERGINLSAFDRNGNQLLHAAVLAQQPALVKLLLAKGANADALTGPSKVEWRYEVNFKSDPYFMPAKSPLLLAAESGSLEIMRMLIDAGADTTFRTADGTNIALAAAASGRLAALQLALAFEPDANVATEDGQTPLHLLMGVGSGPEIGAMMQLLADKGARSNIKNRSGQTPADMAKDAQTDAKAAFAAVFEKRTVSKP